MTGSFPEPPDLSVLVITYNSAADIATCLRAVKGTLTVRHEVIVIDNASLDGTADLVRREHPDVTVVDMGTNAGFARGNNRAIAEAAGRHLLLLNPDTEVRAGALDTLVAFLDADTTAGVAAPRLLNSDGTDQGTARAFPSPAAGLFGRRSPLTRLWPSNRWSRRFLVGTWHDGDGPFEVDWVSGACLMLPASVARRVGGLDEGFFMHFEDTDLCHRIKDAGLRVWCVPDAEVVHHEGGSRRGWPPAQLWHFHHGARRYYRRHALVGWRRRVLLGPLVTALLYGRCAALSALWLLHPARRSAKSPAGPPPSPTAFTTP